MKTINLTLNKNTIRVSIKMDSLKGEKGKALITSALIQGNLTYEGQIPSLILKYILAWSYDHAWIGNIAINRGRDGNIYYLKELNKSRILEIEIL